LLTAVIRVASNLQVVW